MYFYYIFVFLTSFFINVDLKAASFVGHNPLENPEGRDFYKNPEFVKQYYELKQKKQNKETNNENYTKYSTPIALYIEYGAKPIDTGDSEWNDIDYIACNNNDTININDKTENSITENEIKKTGKKIKKNESNDKPSKSDIKNDKDQYNLKDDYKKKKNSCFLRYKEYKDIGKCLNHAAENEIKKTGKKIKKNESNDKPSKSDIKNDKDQYNLKDDYKKKKNSCFLRYKEYKDIGKCLNDNLYAHDTKKHIKLKKTIKDKHIKKYNIVKQSQPKKQEKPIINTYTTKTNKQKSVNKIIIKTIENKANTSNINYTNTSNKIEKNTDTYFMNESCFLNYKNFSKIGKCITYKIYYPEKNNIAFLKIEKEDKTFSKIEKNNKVKIKKQNNSNLYNKDYYINKKEKRIKLKMIN